MPSKAKQVAEVLDQVAASIARLPDATIRDFYEVLKVAERELSRDLAKYLARVGADEKFTAQQMRNALLQIRGSIETIEKMGPQLNRALVNGSHATAYAAASHLADEVALFGEMFDHSIVAKPLNVAAMTARGDRMLIPRFRNSANRYAGQVGADIRQQLAIGMMRGETVFQLSKRLIRHGGPKGLVALRGSLGDPNVVAEHIAEGLFTRYNSWAERLARTEVINAYNTHADLGIREMADEDEDMRSRWDAANDYRVCVICKGLHGQIIKVGGAFAGGYRHPPAHPNCRCAIVAWHKEWNDELAMPGDGRYPSGTFEVAEPRRLAPRAKAAPVAPPTPPAPPPEKFKKFPEPKEKTQPPKYPENVWGKKNYAKWNDSLDPQQARAINNYVGNGYVSVNRQLRNGVSTTFESASARHDIVMITDALNTALVPEGVVVYRGGLVDPASLVPGARVNDKAFMSTSLTKKVTDGFLWSADDSGVAKKVLYEIELPKGTKAGWVRNPYESEMLLQRNTTIEIQEVRYDKETKTYHARARVVDQSPGQTITE